MNEQGERDTSKVEPAGADQPSAPLPYGKCSRGKQIGRDFLRGVFFIVLMLAVKLSIEHTTTSEQMELMGYIWLQQHLSSERIPVHIVDISDLKVADLRIDGRTYQATPRDVLKSLIEEVADQGAKAIGVDIDFSPDKDGYITPFDPEFFRFCLDRRVPVFLGIKRTEILPPEAWLGHADYQTLAASISIPRQDSRKMPKWIQAGKGFKQGRTMSAALASTFGESHCTLGEWLQRIKLAKQVPERKLGQEGGVGEFLVDYSPLDALMEHRLQTISRDGVRALGRLLRDKIVLLGDGTLGRATDTFVVPGRSQPIPGVYLHACAAYTLAMAPLYELTWQGRLLIDAFLSGAILLSITLIRLYYKTKIPKEVATHRLQGLFTWLVVIAAVVVGVLFVRITCVMWSDFILSLGALLLHPSIERRLENFWKFIRKIAPPILRDLVFEQDGEGHK